MKKNRLILGTISFFFTVILLTAHPESAQAASQSAYRTMFDAAYYYDTYPDVAEAFQHDENALFSHFLKFGIDEGRDGSAEFDVSAYRRRYEDLDAAFGDNIRAYYEHYLSYGRNEGRVATISGEAYVGVSRKAAPQVASAPETAETPKKEGTVSGTYTTTYNEVETRAVNIKVAAQRIDGVTVQPGETFSFSSAVLPRTSENGYVTAPVIVSGKMVDGIGGGICQVSSTLYAAMLTAGVPATERYAHSLYMSYVPKGMDATISGNTKDLKFKNIYAAPIVIHASADHGVLKITIETV